MRTKLLSVFIIFELVVVFVLSMRVFFYKKDILGISSVNVIKHSSILFNKNSQLKYFYEPKPNINEIIFQSWFSSPVKYSINLDSLNSMTNFSVNKEKGVFRIITIGDSFTFGQNVDTENNYPSQLMDLLNQNLKCNNINKFEVINLGVYGYDIKYSVTRYRIRGKKYNPDLILFFLIGDDFKRVNELFLPKINNIKVKTDSDYINGTFLKKVDSVRNNLKSELTDGEILEYQKESLFELNDYYKRNLLIFTFPFLEHTYEEIIKKFVTSRENIFYYKNLRNIYDLYGELPDGHPNQKGHQIIAQDLFNYLTENKLIPCN